MARLNFPHASSSAPSSFSSAPDKTHAQTHEQAQALSPDDPRYWQTLARADAERSFMFWRALDALETMGLGAAHSLARSDFGPPERWQHSARVLENADAPGVFRVRATQECALDDLLQRGVINRQECAAGLRLKADFLAAGLAQQIVAHYDRCYTFLTVDATLSERTDKEEEAYERWRSAVRSLKNNLIINAIISVVCCDEMPRPELRAFIKLGLTRLEIYYDKRVGQPSHDDVDKRAARQV